MPDKLQTLSKIEGKTIDQMFEEATTDSIALGICTNEDCTYTTSVEPDQDSGYCEICGTQTVSSCLILGGII